MTKMLLKLKMNENDKNATFYLENSFVRFLQTSPKFIHFLH